MPSMPRHIEVCQNQPDAGIVAQHVERLITRLGEEQLVHAGANLAAHPLPEHLLDVRLVIHHKDLAR